MLDRKVDQLGVALIPRIPSSDTYVFDGPRRNVDLVPISCAVNPSTSRWRISRWRNVNDATWILCLRRALSHLQHLAREIGRNERAPLGRSAYREHQLLRRGMLEHESHGTLSWRDSHKLDVAMHGEKDAHIGIEFPDLFERFDAIQIGIVMSANERRAAALVASIMARPSSTAPIRSNSETSRLFSPSASIDDRPQSKTRTSVS